MTEQPREDVRCHACGSLVGVAVPYGKHMALQIGGAEVFKARLQCPVCQSWRWWYSRPVSAIRLGLPE